MSELSYIEYLNIQTKYKGSILHSYEYNATVEKINEIIDNLDTSYEISKTQPRFTETPDPLASTAPGTGVTINNDTQGKLYPVTSTSYVITNDGKTLETELSEIKDSVSNNYNAGTGITIGNDRSINVNIDNNSIYVNSRGQLVVNNNVVLQGAEERFTFINERGEWVGDMTNVKNYIDNSVNTAYTTLKSDIEEIYTYMTKFTEYDEFGKNYQLSEEFMNEQE